MIHGANKETLISGRDLRRIANSKNIKSSRISEIKVGDEDVLFKGRGWGHGVGMCQWGALGLALVRTKYGEILSHYYPGSILEKLH